MKNFPILLLLLLPLISCEEKNPALKLNEDLIVGAWSQIEYTDSIIVLSKVRSLPDDEYGIEFESNGKLYEWKNSGWCGTPPISFGEFGGSWDFLNDSILWMESEYWGGTLIGEWEILKLNDNTLEYLVIKSDYLE